MFYSPNSLSQETARTLLSSSQAAAIARSFKKTSQSATSAAKIFFKLKAQILHPKIFKLEAQAQILQQKIS